MRPSGVAQHLSEARLVWDLFRSQREGAAGLARRQQTRLAALVTHARASSRFYARPIATAPSMRRSETFRP